MCDGADDGMVCLLEYESESRWWLNVRGVAKVLDAVPRDRVEPLAVHDFFVQSKGLFTSKPARFIICRCCCGSLIRASCDGEEDLGI